MGVDIGYLARWEPSVAPRVTAHCVTTLRGYAISIPARGLHLGGNPRAGTRGALSVCAHLRGIALDRGAEQTVCMALNQAELQVGQGDEPAEVILCHDLGRVRVPGLLRSNHRRRSFLLRLQSVGVWFEPK